MTGTPTLSVVIPTYRRRDSVARVLDALTRQTVPPEEFELIVSIDGSEDGTRELVGLLPLSTVMLFTFSDFSLEPLNRYC
jgi:GT2 family glycosyltransferase